MQGMSLTEQEIEYLADGFRQAGFIIDELSNDQIALIAQIVIDVLVDTEKQ